MRISDWSSDVCSSDLLGSSVLVLTQPSTISFKVVAPALWHWEPLSFKLLSLVINLTPLRWETSTTNGSTTATLVVPANTPISLSEQLLKVVKDWDSMCHWMANRK